MPEEPKKKVYPEGTVFCLRYARRWETLTADNLTAALGARAIKEAALLTVQDSAATAPAKRIGIDDAITVYLSNTAATKKHRTLLAYTLVTRPSTARCCNRRLHSQRSMSQIAWLQQLHQSAHCCRLQEG
jgi:hypothetical protein